MKHLAAVALIILMLCSCSHNKADTVERAVYYWKNNEWSLSEAENAFVKTQGIQKIYVKFFEIEKK